MFKNTRDDIKVIAEKFCNTYFDCWIKAMNVNGCRKYKGIKDIEVLDEKPQGALKKWTDFHMEKILYQLVCELGYKTLECDDCTCPKCTCNIKKKHCGYGESWQQEYYKVDLLLSKYKSAGDWCNDFYIEHENAHFRLCEDDKGNKCINKQGWFDEFHKLLPLKCSPKGMRVIISYDDFNSDYDKVEDKGEYLCAHLNDKESLIQQSLVTNPILVILAPSNKAIKDEKKHCFKMLLFTYDHCEWMCDYGEYSNGVNDIFNEIVKLNV